MIRWVYFWAVMMSAMGGFENVLSAAPIKTPPSASIVEEIAPTLLPSGDKTFVGGFEDIPLMNGFMQKGDIVNFDSPEGRFIEATIESSSVKKRRRWRFIGKRSPN